MRVLIFQQVKGEGPGLFGDLLEKWGIAYDTVAFYCGQAIPPLSAYDALIALGGPMNVYEEDKHPFLAQEDQAIKQAVSQGMPYLGICLGAQLLAKALGAPVTPNPVKELGFGQVRLTAAATRDALFRGLPRALPVFQWHGDTFALPQGAVRLATSPACANQAFRYGRNAYALQFHLEVTLAIVRAWARAMRVELKAPGRPVVGELHPVDLAQRCRELSAEGGLAETLFSHFIKG